MHTQAAPVLADQTFAWSYWRVALPICALCITIACVLVWGVYCLSQWLGARRDKAREAIELERFLAARRGSVRMHEAVINGEVFTPGGEFVDLTSVTVDQPTGEVPYVPPPTRGEPPFTVYDPTTGTTRVVS
jgi:hypothetical protein